ncbi:MAG TPA: serine/threonine-protein kinase [Kofleriaceae bacterium]|jgi:hypothetical protein|nr:serine/threonine-protein kinase [Kofleriaceae bacterium]
MAEAGTAHAPAPIVPGYVIGERLGAGGFGEVWAARHEMIRRDVAIKVLHAKYSGDRDAVGRFVAEARAVNKISHPNIVEISDFGALADGRHYCVMERIRGTTLRDELRTRGRIALDDALPILLGIAEAVDAAHTAGIAHRDLKPDNVFLVEGGGIKLIDFGLAKLTSEDAIAVTETGSVFGTPLYMSPEQCRGKRVTVATDAYSFGVLAYHVLTGETPFSGDALELALHHLSDDPAPPSSHVAELGPRVDRVVLALMAKDPAQRPTSLVAAIESIVEGTLPRQPRRRRRALSLGVVAAVALAGAGAAVRFAGSSSEADEGCTPASERLAPVWAGSTREKILARFVGRTDIVTTGKLLSGNLDRYSAEWSRQWKAACHAPDRKTDPLLYGQRITCLDNAFLALRGYTSSVMAIDVTAFSEGYIGADRLPALPDCESVAVLRVQSPSPPPVLRELVGELVSRVHTGRADERTGHNALRPALVVQGLRELEISALALDVLHVPEAAMAWYWYAEMMLDLVGNRVDPLPPEQRIEVATRALTTARQRATDLRNDVVLAAIAVSESHLARTVAERSPGPEGDAKVAAALTAAEAAITRAGNPLRERGGLAGQRASVALAKRDAAAAERELAVELDVMRVLEPYMCSWLPDEHAALVAQAKGDLAGMVARRRAALAGALELFGPLHTETLDVRQHLIGGLVDAGQPAAARDELRETLRAKLARGADAASFAETRFDIAVTSLQLGEQDAAIDALREIAPDDFKTLLDVMNISLNAGALDVVAWAMLHMSRDAPPSVGAVRAYVAFMRGDLGALREAATPIADKDGLASVMLRYAEALEGRPLTTGSPADLAPFDRGLQAMVKRRWRDAAMAFHDAAELNRKMAAGHSEAIWNVAESLAWEGYALVEANDAKLAIPRLEEAIADTEQCCKGFHYYAPFAQLALARALWDTGGDKEHARKLAELARDNFARVGPGRDPERQKAIEWLAAHP